MSPSLPTALLYVWAAAGIAAIIVFVAAMVREFTRPPSTDNEAYCQQIDDDIRTGRSRLVTGPVIDFGDTAWNATSSALAADTHWEGLEQEWLDYVKRLPQTRQETTP